MKVYTLKGSEDGVMGVYTSKKRAIARGVEYVEDSLEGDVAIAVDNLKWCSYIFGENTSVSAEVETFDTE